MIDWKCEVKTLFRENNLGCKIAVSEAITWFFDNVEEGIIIEDDCLPSPDFFPFCEELLKKFRDNEKIMHISGANYQFGKKHGAASYYFSIYPHIWGWASWRRAWKKYDVNLTDLENFKNKNTIKKIADQPKEQLYWLSRFEMVKNGTFNTWDYQWVFACWNNEGLSISPNYNLVTNIGFNNEATHTVSETPIANMPLEKLNTVIHPNKIIVNHKADHFIFENIFGSPFPKWNDKIRAAVSSLIPEQVKQQLRKIRN